MLHPAATSDVIDAVYRQLAKQYHPDHAGPEGQQRMSEINEAYASLSNPEKRARYDEIVGVSGKIESATYAQKSAPGATNLKYEAGAWTVREPAEQTREASPYGEAGPPPAYLRPRGSVISFGRYRGWTVSQVAEYDRNYVEWLSRTMAGRSYQSELTQILSQTAR